ncbi:MAG: hypothetical protein LBD17_00240 [Endomicrobium sp.]|jgi:hypothetical protein|nr:hypothetical protein [Endomicrobium sp.]
MLVDLIPILDKGNLRYKYDNNYPCEGLVLYSVHTEYIPDIGYMDSASDKIAVSPDTVYFQHYIAPLYKCYIYDECFFYICVCKRDLKIFNLCCKEDLLMLLDLLSSAIPDKYSSLNELIIGVLKEQGYDGVLWSSNRFKFEFSNVNWFASLTPYECNFISGVKLFNPSEVIEVKIVSVIDSYIKDIVKEGLLFIELSRNSKNIFRRLNFPGRFT